MAVVWRSVCGVIVFACSEGQDWLAVAACLVIRSATASRLSGRPRLVAKELARDGEDEEKNQDDYDVVLPGATREVPENEALPGALSSSVGGRVLKHC